jgi:peptide/nickel transport system substrate-binding protein
VKFSLETAKASGFIGLGAIERIEADGHNIRISLFHADPDFLPYLTVGIVKAGSTGRERNAVGTGPYYVESYNTQQSMVLKKFSGYRLENEAGLETITIVFLPNFDAFIPGLIGGSIDGASLFSGLAHQLNPSRFDIIPGHSAAVQLLALNNAAAPFNDIRVRQAINYGIDIQGIIDAAFYGAGVPSGSPLIPGLAAYYEQSLADPYPVNLEKAMSLLAEAGFGEGGQQLTLEIIVPSNFNMHIDTAQVVAGQLSKIGINASIRLVDWATWLSDVYRGRKYQATIISLDSQIVSPRGFLSRYHSASSDNFINFSNADFDRVYGLLLTEPSEERRIELYKEAQAIISANAASVFIQDILGFRAFRAGVYGGVLHYPLYVIDFASMYGR